MSEWICPAACQAVSPWRRCHDCAGLSSPAVKNAIRRSSAKAPRTTVARLDSDSPRSARIAAASSSARAPPARTRGAPRPPPPAAPTAAACAAIAAGTSSEPSSTLATNSTGLAVSGGSSAIASAASAGGGHGPRRPPGLERLDQQLQPRQLGDRVAVAALAPCLRHPVEPALGLLEVGVDSSVSIVSMSASGSTRPSGCTTLSSSCARTTWTIASVSRMLARNWLPRPSPRWAPATSPAMSWKAIVSGTTFDARDDRGDRVEARVGHRHDRDVRLDRRERVVGRLGRDAGQRREQRRLARVRHPDDPDLHRHGRHPCADRRTGAAIAVPSDRAREHVGRVVDAEVRAADARTRRRRRTAAAAGTRPPNARAAANEVVACALGNDSEETTGLSGGRSGELAGAGGAPRT